MYGQRDSKRHNETAEHEKHHRIRIAGRLEIPEKTHKKVDQEAEADGRRNLEQLQSLKISAQQQELSEKEQHIKEKGQITEGRRKTEA